LLRSAPGAAPDTVWTRLDQGANYAVKGGAMAESFVSIVMDVPAGEDHYELIVV